jgi:hypothetical protein
MNVSTAGTGSNPLSFHGITTTKLNSENESEVFARYPLEVQGNIEMDSRNESERYPV